MWCSCTNCSIKRFFSFSQPRREQRGEIPAGDTSLLSREKACLARMHSGFSAGGSKPQRTHRTHRGVYVVSGIGSQVSKTPHEAPALGPSCGRSRPGLTGMGPRAPWSQLTGPVFTEAPRPPRPPPGTPHHGPCPQALMDLPTDAGFSQQKKAPCEQPFSAPLPATPWNLTNRQIHWC